MPRCPLQILWGPEVTGATAKQQTRELQDLRGCHLRGPRSPELGGDRYRTTRLVLRKADTERRGSGFGVRKVLLIEIKSILLAGPGQASLRGWGMGVRYAQVLAGASFSWRILEFGHLWYRAISTTPSWTMDP